MRAFLATVLLAGLLTGCTTAVQGEPVAGAELTERASITEAWKKNVTQAVSVLGAALGKAGQGMVDGDYRVVKDGCADVKAATDGIEEQLPSKDDEVNEALQDTVDEYRSFSDICNGLTPSSAPAEIDRLEASLDRADGRLRDAMGLIGIDMPRR